MIWDPITWFLLLMILVLLILLLRALFKKTPDEPWVLYDSIGVPERTTRGQCEDGGVLVATNSIRNLNAHVELENRGDCKVTLLVAGAEFLEAKPPPLVLGGRGVTYVAAYIPLNRGQDMAYRCASDEAEDVECVFRARVTVR